MGKNINKENSPNGFLKWWELALGNILITSFVAIAIMNKGNAGIVFTAFTFSSLLEIFLIVFRKRPISAYFKIGLTSGIDLRWNKKTDEEVIN